MTLQVTRDFVEFNEECFNLSFILLKQSNASNTWSNFYRKVAWNNEIATPKPFYVLDLGTTEKHIYLPCEPFSIEFDECSTWLEWYSVIPNNGSGDEIKMLHFKSDPATTLLNAETKYGVASRIQHAIYAEQLKLVTVIPIGNFNRMEKLVQRTIVESLAANKPVPYSNPNWRQNNQNNQSYQNRGNQLERGSNSDHRRYGADRNSSNYEQAQQQQQVPQQQFMAVQPQSSIPIQGSYPAQTMNTAPIVMATQIPTGMSQQTAGYHYTRM